VKPYCFLDRDGTLLVDVGYPRDPEQVTWLPGAVESVRQFVAWGFQPVVVSNQSGVGRGWIQATEAAAVHSRFAEMCQAALGEPLPSWYCYHDPEAGCDCRKPAPGLLEQAALHFGWPIDYQSIMIGDKTSDVLAGFAAGCGYNLQLALGWDRFWEQHRTWWDGESSSLC